MVQDAIPESKDTADVGLYTFSVIYNLPNVANGPVDFTCQNNAYVEQPKFGGPYAISTPAYTVQLPIPNPTIQQVMDAVNKRYYGRMPYTTVNIGGMLYVKSLIPLSTYEITADLSNSCYDLSKNPGADFVFWFYSINGKANFYNSGSVGKSFATFTLSPNDTVFWQLIAPDAEYGFQKCIPTEGNQYAL